MSIRTGERENGAERRYGIVEFADASSAANAVASLDQHRFGGLIVRCEFFSAEGEENNSLGIRRTPSGVERPQAKAVVTDGPDQRIPMPENCREVVIWELPLAISQSHLHASLGRARFLQTAVAGRVYVADF